MILLIGATGKTGSLVARNLVARGHRPRALVRKRPRRGSDPGSTTSTATCTTLPRCGLP
jgi:uncharacterized protein YbjT (DUF2867 family)